MCCSDPPPPPDYSSVAEASEEVARIAQETAREQLDWAKEQYTKNNVLLNKVLDVQLPAMQKRFDDYQADRARYEELYQPLEDQLIEEAKTYDSPERREEEAAKAIAETAASFDAQRQNAMRNLEGYGIDPSQTRSQGLDKDVRIAQATASAQAGAAGRDRVEDVGRALRGEAINIGKGYPGQIAQSVGQAVTSGQAALSGAQQNTQVASGAMTAPSAYMGVGNQAISTWGNTLNQGYQNQLDAYNAGGGVMQALGWLVGQLGGAYLGRAAEGGEIEGPGGPKDDAMAIRVSDGEYVIPAEVVKRKGTEFFEKLITKTKEDEMERQGIPVGQQKQAALPPPRGY